LKTPVGDWQYVTGNGGNRVLVAVMANGMKINIGFVLV
jgi:hypothetical protein